MKNGALFLYYRHRHGRTLQYIIYAGGLHSGMFMVFVLAEGKSCRFENGNLFQLIHGNGSNWCKSHRFKCLTVALCVKLRLLTFHESDGCSTHYISMLLLHYNGVYGSVSANSNSCWSCLPCALPYAQLFSITLIWFLFCTILGQKTEEK